ncbi:Ca(2+)-binding ATP:ADP antiporter SAL1 SCDLUD_002830 [Saccharomycodes ludwigii]|uniref:Ca(2+)-binding ATP:ADP antiporter SAL1 n=1 Tax=Saccharomycodes ludwigii TaxID=36035 RepID=UPI001E89A154|nr:hypothetical protein SCDLUD_002830 [Saccharomycodes ludwigii]KAH3901339.1 hypothetical protein SCDLUD_002830 [Saccharomycodes ludwigii]
MADNFNNVDPSTETIKQKDERFKGLYNSIDVNKTGKVDLKTLKKAFQFSNHPFKDNDDAITTIFNNIDINHDHIIDYHDFVRYVLKAEQEIKNGFDKIDKDKDGKVNSEEIMKYLAEKEQSLGNDTIDLSANSGKLQMSDKDTNTNMPENHNNLQSKKNNFKNFISWAFKSTKQQQQDILQHNHHQKSEQQEQQEQQQQQSLKTDNNNNSSNTKITDSLPNTITYNQWRNFLIFMPRKQGSRLHTAYSYYSFYLFNEDVDLSSEGDMTLINDFIKGGGFFIAGGLSGVISRTCTAPFDRIKVFLIARTDLSSTLLNSKSALAAHAKHPTSDLSKIQSPLVKAIKTIYRQGGLKSFYVGNGLNVIKVFPESAIKFGSFELTKKMMATLEGANNLDELSKFSTYLAGGMAGVMAQFSVYPIDTLKYRMQCAPLDNKLKGNKLLITTAKEMYNNGGGLRIFYRGVGVGVMGIFPYAALDLGTFTALKKWFIQREALKRHVPVEDVTLSNFIVLPMGAFSGTVGATLVYPINLLRTRLQAQGTFAHPYTYNGFFDVFRKTVAREGYQGLFKGLVPNIAKVCPAVSISYLCYENLKKILKLEQ